MSPGTIALIVVAASIAAWGLFMANITIRRHRKEPALATARSGTTTATSEPAAKPAAETTVTKVPEKARKPLTPDQMAVSRRQFLNRAWTASFTGFLGLFGMSTLSFLWPKLTGGFGTVINAGNFDDLVKEVGPEVGFKPKFIAEGRFWLVYYEGTGEAPVYELIGVSQDQPLMALYRKCVHLGCSVPHCEKSMLFECPCHGSKYRLNGEYYGGPAPRGLDRFPIEVSDGKVMVDTGARQDGPPRGINTWQKFAGPQGGFCVPT
ncbi:MAG: ubiquinol-cytochrome c reductase iron-sulfur subunit [Actinomycetota bacterium]